MFVYKDDHIDYIQTSEGRMKWDDGDSLFYAEYFIKDHLGNVRAVVTPDENNEAIVIQASDYYPFGMAFTKSFEYSGGKGTPFTNKYFFNTKEQQEMPGKWLDFGARLYDPQLGRWHVMDLYSEKYYNFSPYSYGANNPVLLIDINGDSLVFGKSILENKQLSAALAQFANTKEGMAFLSEYAAKGQSFTIGDKTFSFEKDGEYSSKGIDLTYTAKDLGEGSDWGITIGETEPGIKENGRFGIEITINTNAEATTKDPNGNALTSFDTRAYESTKTLFHESFIHAILDTKDFLDDGRRNYSNISQNAKSAVGMPSHYQHAQVLLDYAKDGDKSRNLWPASAYWGLQQVNKNLHTNYSPQTIVDNMWNYKGGSK
jgi:RHS repeat-associated protein